jgi:small subunit ribosomal protein S2
LHTVLTTISLRCIQVIAGVLGRAGEAGQKQRLAAAAKGDITYQPADDLALPGTEEEGEGASPAAPASFEDVVDTNEVARKLDDVNNHEDHRLKGGRALKASS